MTEPVSTRVVRVRDLLPDMRMLDLAVPPDWRWRAGQYLQLHLADFPPRFYSIGSIGADHVISLHIRNTGAGGVSQAVLGLNAGDTVSIAGPMGSMDLSRAGTRPIAMIAGGTGIAPFCAMLSALAAGNHAVPVTLFWGVRQASEFYCQDRLEALRTQIPALTVMTVAEDRDGITIADALTNYAPGFAGMHLYLAGPRAMVETTLPTLLQHGADPAHIDGDDPAIETIRSLKRA